MSPVTCGFVAPRLVRSRRPSAVWRETPPLPERREPAPKHAAFKTALTRGVQFVPLSPPLSAAPACSVSASARTASRPAPAVRRSTPTVSLQALVPSPEPAGSAGLLNLRACLFREVPGLGLQRSRRLPGSRPSHLPGRSGGPRGVLRSRPAVAKSASAAAATPASKPVPRRGRSSTPTKRRGGAEHGHCGGRAFGEFRGRAGHDRCPTPVILSGTDFGLAVYSVPLELRQRRQAIDRSKTEAST